jgi:2-amino-4-hydroxy-6-hydroxymethyldihydropteridine diphosphokinase
VDDERRSEPVRRRAGKRAVVGLGANLGDRRRTLALAVEHLAQKVGPIVALSHLIETEALIHPDDPAQSYPPFLNGVVVLSTYLEPLPVLDQLQVIERGLGRDRSKEPERWRPRVIDLDFIAYEDAEMATERLTLPHPEMHKRDFVLRPMVEVWPDWQHPGLGRTAAELLADLEAGR